MLGLGGFCLFLFLNVDVCCFPGILIWVKIGCWAVAIREVGPVFCDMGLIFVICIGVLIKLLLGLSLIALGLFWKISG